MKTIGIEEFLRWAFVSELAKGGGVEGLASAGSAWRAIEGVASLGCRVDTSMPSDWTPSGWCDEAVAHPDAILAGRSVMSLAHAGIGVPEDWNPVGDWTDVGELEREAVARAIATANGRGGASLVALVIRMATLGAAPGFAATQPKRRMVTMNGTPAWFAMKTVRDCLGRERHIEVSGFDKKRRRPLPKAYRKFELSRDPLPDLLGRADYQLWRAALDYVFEDLAGTLQSHFLLSSHRPWWPWEEDATVPEAARAGRIFVV